MPRSNWMSRYDVSGGNQNLSAGSILWLPAKTSIDKNLLAGSTVDDGCFKNPFLILYIDSTKYQAIGLILTSLGEQNISDRHRFSINGRLDHLPIFPSPVHPDLGIQLFLGNNLKLLKDSYVKTRARVTIDCRALRHYDRTGRRYSLALDSYKILISHMESTLQPALPFTSAVPPVPRDHSVRQQSTPYPFSSTVAQSISRELQNLHRSISAPTSSSERSTEQMQAQPAIVPPVPTGPPPVLFNVPQYTTFPTRPVPVGRESYQGRRIYGIRPLNERVPLLPHAHLTPGKPVYHPFAKLSAILPTLILLLLAAYGAYWWSGR